MPAPAAAETLADRRDLARRVFGEDLPELPPAPELVVWLGGPGQLQVTDTIQTINPDGEPDLGMTLTRVRRTADGHELRDTFGRRVFGEFDINGEVHSFLRRYSAREVCCEDTGEPVDKGQVFNHLSTLHQVINIHAEGKY